MTETNLISSVVLQGREYLIKMNASNRCLDLLISDKQTGEEWQCSYDHSYIENLTHKTGNFKQFEVFISMIKSGLLKVRDNRKNFGEWRIFLIYRPADVFLLELLTFEDLESLRSKKIRGTSRNFSNTHGNNKRYLIVIYTVEFDRIHYPLPLEYCGPPDPTILQATIRRLEAELTKARDENYFKCTSNDSKHILSLQRRIDDLLAENLALRNEIRDMNQILENTPSKQVQVLQRAIVNLEKSVLCERKSHHKLVEKLRSDKIKLVKELEKARSSERSLRNQLEQNRKNISARKYDKRSSMNRSNNSLETIYRRPSPVMRSHSEGRNNIRIRSVSPRLIKSEDWEQKGRVSNLRLNNISKQRSRSSSLSSTRNYPLNDFFAVETDVMEERLNRKPGKRSRRQTKFSRSRTSSVNSSDSSKTDEIGFGKDSVRSIKTKLKTSKKEFQTLEKRIQALQGILKDNLRMKDF